MHQIHQLIANGRYFVDEWKIISRERPDAVLVRYNVLGFSSAVLTLIKKFPFVLEINAPMAYETQRFMGHVFRLPFVAEALERMNLRLADKVIVVSEEIKNFYLNWGIPPQKISVVPNGVDERMFHPEVSSKRIASHYGLRGKTVVGFVGSFHYWHGVENLLALIQRTLSTREDVVFLLVGDGPLREKMETLFEEEKRASRVVFTGYVPHAEIPAYLAAMDIVLAPYPHLALFYYSPLKLFEYMAAGKAVLASRIGQIGKIITDGYDGILVEPDDIDDLNRRTFQLIGDRTLRRRMGANARRTVLEKHTWAQTAQAISRILTEVVGEDTAVGCSSGLGRGIDST